MKVKRTPGLLIDNPDLMRLGTEEQVAKVLLHDDGPKPYCTCGQSGGFSFDQQLGIFVHINDKGGCYKPSKAYFNAAVAAGIIYVGLVAP